MGLLTWVILLAAAGLAYLLHQDYQKRKNCKIPGPPGQIILGNTIEATKNFDRILDWHLANTEKYGLTWTFTVLGQPRRIITADPKNIEHILKKNFDNYEKGLAFKERLHDLLGDGIFNADGETWRTQRKTASNIFSVKNFKDNMLEVFVRHGRQVLKILDDLKPGEAINMHDLFHRYTLDSIGDIAFGVEIGSIEDSTVPFARAFDFAQYVVLQRFTSPFWKLRKIFSPEEAQFRKSRDILHDFCQKVVNQRRQEQSSGKHKMDLLSLFMEKKDENGNDFTDEYLRDLMMNFIIAGRDTTANGLSWAFYMLAKHQEVEEKLIKEIDETFGTEEPDYNVKDMKYATAFVSETLRLFPSVPKDPKSTVHDDVLPDGTQVHAGDWVVYVPWTMGRLTAIWGDDAKEFNPERWIEDPKPSPYKFPVFQAGPRTCLGQDMAYLEMKTLISMILQKYKLRLVPGQNIRYQNNITLPMVDAKMMMYAEKRQ